MSERRRDAGLTLLEMMVAITVIGVAMTVAAPALSIDPTASDDVETVRKALREGSALSARADLPTTVAVDPTGPAIELRMRDSVVRRLLLTGPTMDGSAGDVRFLPDGRAHGGPLLVRSAGGPRAITVDPWTSRVSVEKR